MIETILNAVDLEDVNHNYLKSVAAIDENDCSKLIKVDNEGKVLLSDESIDKIVQALKPKPQPELNANFDGALIVNAVRRIIDNDEKFYELMQSYRTAPTTNQEYVEACYRAVIKYINGDV